MNEYYVMSREALMELVERARRPSNDVRDHVSGVVKRHQPRSFRRTVVNQFIRECKPTPIQSNEIDDLEFIRNYRAHKEG